MKSRPSRFGEHSRSTSSGVSTTSSFDDHRLRERRGEREMVVGQHLAARRLQRVRDDPAPRERVHGRPRRQRREHLGQARREAVLGAHEPHPRVAGETVLQRLGDRGSGHGGRPTVRVLQDAEVRRRRGGRGGTARGAARGARPSGATAPSARARARIAARAGPVRRKGSAIIAPVGERRRGDDDALLLGEQHVADQGRRGVELGETSEGDGVAVGGGTDDGGREGAHWGLRWQGGGGCTQRGHRDPRCPWSRPVYDGAGNPPPGMRVTRGPSPRRPRGSGRVAASCGSRSRARAAPRESAPAGRPAVRAAGRRC